MKSIPDKYRYSLFLNICMKKRAQLLLRSPLWNTLLSGAVVDSATIFYLPRVAG